MPNEKTTQVSKATTKQRQALEALASTLVAHGAPAGAPFAWLPVPSLAAIMSLDPATAAEWGIALVHAIFREDKLPNAVTTATKRVGNAARGVRRALEYQRKAAEAARLPPETIIFARLAA